MAGTAEGTLFLSVFLTVPMSKLQLQQKVQMLVKQYILCFVWSLGEVTRIPLLGISRSLVPLASRSSANKYTTADCPLCGICGFFLCFITIEEVQAVDTGGRAAFHKPTAMQVAIFLLIALR